MVIEHMFDVEQAVVLADLDRFGDEVSWAVTVDELEHGTTDDSAIPVGLEELGPGAMLAGALAVLDGDRVSAHDHVVVLQALGRMVAHLQARSYGSMGAIWDAEDEAVAGWSDGAQLGWESAVAEIGAALHLTRRAAEKDLGFVTELRRLPRLVEAFQSGLLDYRRAAVLGYGTTHLSEETARVVIDQIIEVAPRLTTGQLRARLRKLCVEADPADARRRYEAAVDGRRVVTEMNGDGTANLLALDQPAEVVQAIRSRIFTLANHARTPGDHRSPDQRRADVMIDLLLGTIGHGPTCRGGSVDLVVDLATLAGLTKAPGDLGGMGPVIADVARQISERQTDSPWTWSLTDPDTGRVIDTGITRRRPASAQRRRIRGRDRSCVFPGCRMPARNCDLDHTQEWARGGHTTVCNCAPLCRTHHRLKTYTTWRYRRLGDGDYVWTSPLGHTYPTSGRDP